jgi:small subunit ribosomal protein S2
MSLDKAELQRQIKELLNAKVHLGHRAQLWNSKMKKYILKEEGGIHIIHPLHTLKALNAAENFVSGKVARGATILFVGTKRSSSEIVQEEANRCNMFYVNNRWLGGTLTNFSTIKQSIDKLIRMESETEQGLLDRRTKKERLDHERQINKMTRSLGGIKTMTDLPDILFVIDPKREHNAIKEAKRLKIPVIAICDTNCDPSGIDYIIPGNDDGLKSVRLFASRIADAITLGKEHSHIRAREDAAKAAEEIAEASE